ncbi:MAG: carboxypeptidase regulatory-like domain-containing protein [Acidobacteriota bacterium]|nr:carboxypeptidase regulatory-like domain-containing protein [Acidobacteriota bacterium]
MSFKSSARFVAITAVLLAGVVNVYADVYGSISGVIRDNGGSPLPGVTITATSPVLPKGRDTFTDSTGNYSFQKLPPGRYTVTATLAGLGTTRGDAVVGVDQNTPLNLKLTPAVSESITVSAAAPTVDMKSTEVNFNYDAKTIEKLPLPRTYQGLFQLAPGVAEGTGFAPVSGGGRQENSFLLDGASVTNPLFGYVGIMNTDTNELDIADVNVKRGAFSAEFGRATGLVFNAVTKSGTNELAGAVREELQPASWSAGAKDPTAKINTDRSRTAANIGGPIWRDHIFGYASGRYEKIDTKNRTNFFGAVPDEKQTIKEVFGKLTVSPTSSQFVSAGYRHIPLNDPNSGIGYFFLPERATDFKNVNRIGTLDYNWNSTRNTLIEAKVLQSSESNDIVARTDLGFKPAFNINDLRHMGAVSIPDPRGGGTLVSAGGAAVKENLQDYKNNQAKVALSQFFDFAGMNHQVKVGAGYEYGEEHLHRSANGWGTITTISGGRLRARYYPDQPPLLSFGKTYSIYAQDSVTITPRLNVDLGVLSNRDEFGEKGAHALTFLKFNFGEQIQPRIGVNYNLRANSGDKLYANYARYSNMEQKSTARGLAPFGLITATATFNATTGALLTDSPNTGETGNAIILPGTKPTYTDEYLVGYARPLASAWSFDAFGMFRDTKRFIEDFPVPQPDGDFFAGNLSNAKRRYYGVTVDLARHLANRWSADINYTWSRLYGNFDFDYPGGGGTYNTASALEDGGGLLIEDPLRYGPFWNNRTHVFKAFASYEVMPNLNFGGFYRFQSGAPWTPIGQDVPYGFYDHYLERAGSHHLSNWSNFDLSASYGIPVGRSRVSLEGRILNALNQQTVLSVDRVPYLDPPVPTATFPFIAQPTTKPNPTYGKATSWAAARRFIASVRVDF